MSGQPTAADRFRTLQVRLFAATGLRTVSRILRVRDTWVHVIEAGTGPPAVLLHGEGSVAASWEPLLGRLQADFHLVAPDMPGCGLSESPAYRGTGFRDDAVAFVEGVLDALGIVQGSLMGSSMGGYWALAFALAHPARVQRLILLGPPAGSTSRPSLGQGVIATPGLGWLLQAAASRRTRSRLRERMGRRLVAHPERLTEPMLDTLHAGSTLPGARRARRSMVREMAPPWRRSRLTYALRDELPGMQVPALMIWGERDPCPLRWGRQLCDLVPEARLEVVPDAGRMVWLDEPVETAGLVQDFLGVRSSARESVARHKPA